MNTSATRAAHGGMLRLFTGLAGAVRRRVRQHRAEQMLMGMDDAMLSDIGINRGDIPSLVRHGRS